VPPLFNFQCSSRVIIPYRGAETMSIKSHLTFKTGNIHYFLNADEMLQLITYSFFMSCEGVHHKLARAIEKL
jgi:hypothetical protein